MPWDIPPALDAPLDVVQALHAAAADRLRADPALAPYIGDRWVIVHVDGEGWEVPGGTVEPGETPIAALHRELMEEAGAAIVGSPRVIGAWHHLSREAAPYRPHHPHPEFYRVVWVGEVDIVAPPTNPEGSLAVSRVDVVSLEVAVARFQAQGRPDLAELYEFAAACRWRA